MTEPRRNSSLVAKSNARLAAAQLLYRVAITGEKLRPERLAADYADYMNENQHDPKEAALPHIPPNKAYLRKLLDGMAQHDEVLDKLLDEHLSADWKRERMSPLMIAILKLGFYELDAFRNLATPVLVDEYTTLARRFFDEQDVSFAHATLFKVAQKLRA